MSATPCKGCGAKCAWAGVAEEGDSPVCWGRVSVIDDVEEGDGGWTYIHACDGHAPIWDGGEFKPEPLGGDPFLAAGLILEDVDRRARG
jgi:hypothetical protein